MHLTLSIDLDAISADPAAEVGRILRYWAGAMQQMDLTAPAAMPLMDSDYRQVGELTVSTPGT